MATNKNFDEFLSRQSRKAQSFGNVDGRKAAWLAKIEELYDTVAEILQEYVGRQQLTLSREPMVIHEDLLGSYPVQSLKLSFGYANAEFRPKGTFLIGTPGRVDLAGGRGEVRFLLVGQDVTRPSVTIRAVKERESNAWDTPDPSVSTDLRDFVWKISSEPPRITYDEINEDTLTKAIMAVANG